MIIPPFFISNPHSNRSVQGIQSFPEKALRLGLEPTTVSRGVRRTRRFRSEKMDSPCQRYYSCLKLISLCFNSNPHSNQSVQGFQNFWKNHLSLGLEPTTIFSCGPNYSPIKQFGTARKTSRGFKSQAELFKKKTLGTLDTLVGMWV